MSELASEPRAQREPASQPRAQREPASQPRAQSEPASGPPAQRLLLERALLPDGVHDDVLVEIADGVITRVEVGGRDGEAVLGLTVPGLANTHSHAFHRALRGHAQRRGGTFWQWREQMYDVAARLDPDSYRALAAATYREMVAAGYTAVAEFHYLHHQPDGSRYDDPNEMGHALLSAAAEAGIRLTLLDACYLSAGFGAPPEGVQVRYSDGSVDAWAERVAALRAGAGSDAILGAAIHSVRAVPPDAVAAVAAWARAAGAPLHAHLSEQPAENDGCLAAYGLTPTALLAEHGALGPATTLVHATHLTPADIATLGGPGTSISLCPTTERDLADGIGLVAELRRAGCRLSVGSDSQAVVDPFEELRALELDERLASRTRGHFTAADLLAIGADRGALGREPVAIAPGHPADLVTLDVGSIRTAGTGAAAETAVFAATGADVVRTMIAGRVVFERGDEAEIGQQLARATEGLNR